MPDQVDIVRRGVVALNEGDAEAMVEGVREFIQDNAQNLAVWEVTTFEQGRIARFEQFGDRVRALAAVAQAEAGGADE